MVLNEPLIAELGKIYDMTKEQVLDTFDERNERYGRKSVVSYICRKSTQTPELVLKYYKSPHHTLLTNKFDKENTPSKEYKLLCLFNEFSKEKIVAEAVGYIPSLGGILMKYLHPNQTIEDRMVELDIEINELLSKNDKANVQKKRKEQFNLIDKGIESLVAFQKIGEKLKEADKFKDESGRSYYAPQMSKEEECERISSSVKETMKLKRMVGKNNYKNGSAKLVDLLINTIINYLCHPDNAPRRNKVTHGDFGPYNVTTEGIVFDLSDLGLDYEEKDFAKIIKNPFYPPLPNTEIEEKFFKKFLAIKYSKELGEKTDSLKNEKFLNFYSPHARILFYNIIRNDLRVLGSIARTILNDKIKEKKWVEDHKKTISAAGALEYYMKDIIKTIKYMVDKKHAKRFFYTEFGVDNKSISSLEEIMKLFRDIKLNKNEKQYINAYVMDSY